MKLICASPSKLILTGKTARTSSLSAARAMRQILVSHARNQQAQKRGGGAHKVDLDEAALVSPEESKQIVELHEALEQLSALDSRKAQIVELKYFGGLNYNEIAEVLKFHASP
jgi:RNA polymerase sigma factor (TIGR02999 family)